jgi:hypothetical protein
MRRFTFPLVLVATGCVFLPGCGSSRPETAHVTGKVTLGGKALPHGTVTATPAKGRSANGQIQPDGTFVLSTYAEGDGAVVGKHVVTVVCVEQVQSATGSVDDVALGQHRSLIPTRYGEISTSGLTFEVEAGKDNVMNLELTLR